MKDRSISLSEREKEVLKLLATGLSNKEIAVSIRVSPSTVKRHVENILKKLQLKNRIEAAVYAVTKMERENVVAVPEGTSVTSERKAMAISISSRR